MVYIYYLAEILFMKLHKLFLWLVLLIPCRFGDRLLFNELILPIVFAWLCIEVLVRNLFLVNGYTPY